MKNIRLTKSMRKELVKAITGQLISEVARSAREDLATLAISAYNRKYSPEQQKAFASLPEGIVPLTGALILEDHLIEIPQLILCPKGEKFSIIPGDEEMFKEALATFAEEANKAKDLFETIEKAINKATSTDKLILWWPDIIATVIALFMTKEDLEVNTPQEFLDAQEAIRNVTQISLDDISAPEELEEMLTEGIDDTTPEVTEED